MLTLKSAPMGWNSWDCYGASVTEDIVRQNADYMAKHLKPYGWEYVVVDIQWSEPGAKNHEYRNFTELTMDEYSRLLPAENRFPSAAGGKGFAPLADYVHSLGLKFGIHIMRGIPRQAVHRNTAILGSEMTARQIAKQASICPWNTDMYGVDVSKEGGVAYYQSLFALYASWGVDFVKVDDIANHYAKDEIECIAAAIDTCGRDMVLSISPGPTPITAAEHLKQYVNMWRITDDFWDKWELLYDMFSRAEQWCHHAIPGHFPDADMLPLGAILQDYDPANRTKFTLEEQKTMMTLWCFLRSPLIMGGELTKCDDDTLRLLTNEDLLQVQKASRYARPVYRRSEAGGEAIVWVTTGEAGEYYVALFNAGETVQTVSVLLSECCLFGSYSLYDLWEHREVGSTDHHIFAVVPPHGVASYRLTPQ